MSDLKEDLTDLTGVGDATAESILDVLAEYEPDAEATVVTGYLAKACDAAEDGDERDAAMYLRRWTTAAGRAR